MSSIAIEFEKNGQKEIFEINKVAKQADGSVWLKSGNNVLLATIVSETTSVDEDFMPLTVQYLEKAYAVGKFPGGFIKRESKPGEFEILTSRIVDRSLRPLFPKGYYYPTQVSVFTLSCDENADLQTLALNAASAALYLSDIPVEALAVGIRIGKIEGEFVLNPTLSQMAQSTLDLFLAGTKNELLMIEMVVRGKEKITVVPQGFGDVLEPALMQSVIEEYHANEIKEEELLEAIRFGVAAIERFSCDYEEAFAPHKKSTRQAELKSDSLDSILLDFIRLHYATAIDNALTQMAKSERSTALKEVLKTLQSHELLQEEWDKEILKKHLEVIKRERVRQMIIQKRVRADGRSLTEVRPISIETNILPGAHGSCLFTRGQTQSLSVATLGSEMDKQSYENLTDRGNKNDRFTFHYNFPSFSVGEAGRIGAPGRRELGHGNLAKRALEALIPSHVDQAMRVVSEILESNGSSSMASVCAGCLALRGADVPLTSLAAGVAMGLIVEGDDYAILTDIMGLEDHDGDMDFKVAGTRNGVTALQMDIKLGGVRFDILQDALMQAKEGRMHILGLMEEAEQAIQVNSDILPRMHTFSVSPDRIVDIIGQAGKTIKEIIERFQVAIDLDRDKGNVKITGRSAKNVDDATDYIKQIVSKEPFKKKVTVSYNVGEKINGKVKTITDFGAFVELPGGVTGLIHISKLSKTRIEKVTDVVKEGDDVSVNVLDVSKNKTSLELIEVLSTIPAE